jgi:hypothetical protein
LFSEHGYCLPTVTENENVQQQPEFSITEHNYCLPSEANDGGYGGATDEVENELNESDNLENRVELQPSFFPNDVDMCVVPEEMVHNTTVEADDTYSFLVEGFETDGETSRNAESRYFIENRFKF